ncbi:PAS domain-containing hybrid sensor histidine kinase/response regulator [Thiomicrospira microaerophila]|uniref:PAS domain-containing hybrid sensor histidine kinase/response regulator n=1 Tax=Thiomicrospira microaerophila TaxID=406020 RepID=UPI000697E68A|nr:PAS domain-containing hybrid sensor histidine kinase/response regulator [Thiomicrospira microaerophila]
MDVNAALIDLYQDSELAVAFIQRQNDADWQILWQNPTARMLWGEYDINLDVELKLRLLSALQTLSAKSFKHFPLQGVQAYQFILNHYQDGFILQFLSNTEEDVRLEVAKYDEAVCHNAIEAAGLALFDWDLLEDKIHYTDLTYKICEVSPVEMGNTKQALMARIHPQDVNLVAEEIDAHLETKWPLNLDFRLRSSNGQYIWLKLTGRAQWEPETDLPMRLVGSLRDISEQKRTEQTVYQRESLIEQIFDALPVSIYVKDGHGCFRFFSKQTEALTGVSRNKAIGRTDFEIFSTEMARQNIQLDAQAREAGKLLMSEQKRIVDGQPHCFMTGRGPVTIQNLDQTSSTWLLGFALDITERYKMEEDLRSAKLAAEDATKAKSDFLSVMSHEIRTPLNAVIGTSSLLLDSDLRKEQIQQMQMIKRSGEHLLYLINDILDFNKLDSGQMQLEHRAFSLFEQLETVASILGPEAQMKGLLFKTDYAAELAPFIWGDEARLRQVLLNLMGNSIKFTEKGSVTLRVSLSKKTPGYGRFEIRDTGIGIAQQNIGKLFSEFMQADSSTTRKYGGTGLGLAICKKLVEAMKGQIGVDSEVGKGSCFWFEIPTPAAASKAVDEANLTQNFDEQRPLDILVAEDNLSNQMLIRAILTKLGHKITLANNGLEALKQLAQRDFDLILMDMQMPELDGLEATKRIRALGDNVKATIPVIALTANALSGDKERVLDAGMNDYLTKPIDIHALKRALWKWSQV